jgi:hypothetical protein
MLQKSYWNQIVELCPDMNDSTVIISEVGQKNYTTTRYINTFTPQSDIWILYMLFEFPNRANRIPCLAVLQGWQNNVKILNGELTIELKALLTMTLKDSNVIFLKMNSNFELVRIDSTLTIKDKTIHLKPRGVNNIDKLKKSKLYDLMIKPD